MLKDVSSYCRVCRGCRVHCRGTVVPGHALVPFASATNCKECCKKAFSAPQIAHFTKDPVVISCTSSDDFTLHSQHPQILHIQVMTLGNFLMGLSVKLAAIMVI